MTTAGLVANSQSRRIPELIPATLGLAAAATVALLTCDIHPKHALSLGQIVSISLDHVLVVSLTAALTIKIFAAVRPKQMNEENLMLRTAFVAAWLVPCTILVGQQSTWAIFVTAVFISSLVMSFPFSRASSDGARTAEPLRFSLASDTYALPQSSLLHQVQSIGAMISAQIGVLAALAGYLLPGVALVGASAAVWTRSFSNRVLGERQSHLTEPTRKISLLLTSCVVVTTMALMSYLPKSSVFRLGIPSIQSSNSNEGERHNQTRVSTTHGKSADLKAAYVGVLLWPKKQIITKLIAPPPISWKENLSNNNPTSPLVIPFEGVYWFFRSPDHQPPSDSREAHGSPEMFDIRSNDLRPLLMQAHQNLGTLINLDCCSRVEVAVRNSDRYPNSVALELILIDTSSPGRPSQSLGREMVNSTPFGKLSDHRPPASETLKFLVPADSRIHRFDEMMIAFRLDDFRAAAAAKIGIDHFTLVPKGM